MTGALASAVDAVALARQGSGQAAVLLCGPAQARPLGPTLRLPLGGAAGVMVGFTGAVGRGLMTVFRVCPGADCVVRRRLLGGWLRVEGRGRTDGWGRRA